MTSSKASVTSIICDQLRSAILTGELPPNSKLRLEELSGSYGVSMSPLREALIRLISEKLVVAKDQRGFTVADVSIPNLKEVTALRGLLEPYAISASIEHADLAWEEKLISLSHRLDRLDSECKAAPSAALIQEWEQAHREFHLSLLERGAMPLLSGICSTLYDLADRYRRLYLAKNPPQRCVADEHKAILKAVLAKNREAASRELLDHINRTSDVILSYMDQQAEA